MRKSERGRERKTERVRGSVRDRERRERGLNECIDLCTLEEWLWQMDNQKWRYDFVDKQE